MFHPVSRSICSHPPSIPSMNCSSGTAHLTNPACSADESGMGTVKQQQIAQLKLRLWSEGSAWVLSFGTVSTPSLLRPLSLSQSPDTQCIEDTRGTVPLLLCSFCHLLSSLDILSCSLEDVFYLLAKLILRWVSSYWVRVVLAQKKMTPLSFSLALSCTHFIIIVLRKISGLGWVWSPN